MQPSNASALRALHGGAAPDEPAARCIGKVPRAQFAAWLAYENLNRDQKSRVAESESVLPAPAFNHAPMEEAQ